MTGGWRPMKTAPRDGGTEVWINTYWGPVLAHFVDCRWLRERCKATDLPGDPSIKDCWRTSGGMTLAEDDLELEHALGWKPTYERVI